MRGRFSLRDGVSRLLAHVGRRSGGVGPFLVIFCLSIYQEDFVCAFLLDLLALLLAVQIGTFVLGQPMEELHELAEELDGGGRWNAC